MTITEPKLAGLRVLLVEDSFLVARSIAHMLTDLGCKVVGPFSNSDDALGAVRANECDAGVLDVNLGNETSERVAEQLAGKGLPFFFVTGYHSPPLTNPRFSGLRRVFKPVSEAGLAEALNRTLGPAA